MSLNPRLTMIDMYNYDNTLFDMLSFPSAANIDRELFVNNLLVTYGEQRVIYPNIPFFKLATRVWSQKWEQSILRIVRTLGADYDPLHNYDRTETETITDEGQEKTTFGNTSTTTFNTLNTVASSGQDKTTFADTETRTFNDTETTTFNVTETESKEEVGEGSRSGTTETETSGTIDYEVSAFNQSTYQPDRKEIKAGTDSVTTNEDSDNTVTTESEHKKTGTEATAHTGTQTDAHTGTDTTDKTGSGTDAKTGTEATAKTGADTVDSGNERNRELRAYGNIGVTTNQQMLKEEMMIRQNVNLYDVLAEMFFREFCVYVY